MIAGAKCSSADQDDRLMFGRIWQAGELMADEQAREVIGLLVGRQLRGEPKGTGTEQGRKHATLAIVGQRHARALIKRLGLELLACLLGTPQDAVLAQHRKHFASHEGIEMGNAAFHHLDPFGMAAGQADQHLGP